MIHRFHTRIAKEYGIVEAVLFFNIAYWVRENEKSSRNFHDGYCWFYNSVREIAETTHDYLTENQIRRALKHLVESDMLYRGIYNKKLYDRTYWYTLTPKARLMLDEIEMELDKK
ncbi:MAG: hypothetical protein ACLRWH_03125 [Emergencia sp.]